MRVGSACVQMEEAAWRFCLDRFCWVGGNGRRRTSCLRRGFTRRTRRPSRALVLFFFFFVFRIPAAIVARQRRRNRIIRAHTPGQRRPSPCEKWDRRRFSSFWPALCSSRSALASAPRPSSTTVRFFFLFFLFSFFPPRIVVRLVNNNWIFRNRSVEMMRRLRHLPRTSMQ